MKFFQLWLNSYLRPRQVMDAIAQLDTPHYGAFYTFMRGLVLALFFYLPFHLL